MGIERRKPRSHVRILIYRTWLNTESCSCTSLFFCGEVYFFNSSPCSYHALFYGHAMFKGNSQKEARYYLFRFLSLSGLSLARFKITADILIAFAGELFTEKIEDRESR